MPRPFIPVPNTVSVEFIYAYHATTTMENVIHVAKNVPFTLAQISSLRAALASWYAAHLQIHTYSNLCLTRIRTKALDTSGSPIEDFTLSTALCGTTGAGSPLPGSVCIALKLATGVAGRSNRGRIYWPITNASLLDSANGSNLSSAWGGFYVADWTSLIAAIQAWDSTAHWVVTSFRNNGAWRSVGLNNNVTAVVLVDYHIDSQRRRLIGRGI